MPTSKAFVTRRMLAPLTKETMTGAFVSNFLICSKAYSSLVPHFLDLPMHVRPHKRLDIVEIPRRTDPGKLLSLDWFWGFGASTCRFHSLLGDLQPLSREHFSHVLQAQLAHVLQAQPMLFKLSSYVVEVFIKFLGVTAKYSHICFLEAGHCQCLYCSS